MSTVITPAELKHRIDSATQDFVLIDTLKSESYEARHVPDAINVPEGPDFIRDFEAKVRVPKDRDVIVYCSSETCQRHIRAAEALEKAGYSNVIRFSAGLAGWQNAGFAFELADDE